jgi:photosystem I subunit 2
MASFTMSAARVAPAMNVAGARKSAFSGKPIVSRAASLKAPRRSATFTVRAADAAPAKTEKKEEEKPWSPPKLNPNTPSPIFGGSTGGLLRKAQVEEFYVLTWESPKEMIFEMPTGGAAIMRKGPNLLKLARKEQCLALLNSMRAKNKINGCIYRVFPSGEVQYLHPKDGVYPEKVNKGRVGVNNNMRSIGKNANAATIKFGGKLGKDGLASDGAGFSRAFDQ